MFGKKKTTEKKTSSAAKSTTKKPATKKPASRTTKVVSKTETKELAEYIRQKHTEEPEFQYIANEAHYDKVIEKIKDCKKTLWMRLRASANVKNFLSCKRTKSVLALLISKTYM